jgi:hypothetical protein
MESARDADPNEKECRRGPIQSYRCMGANPISWLPVAAPPHRNTTCSLYAALLTTCSKRRSPPGVDVPGGWICRHRAQPNSSHIPPPHGHLGAAVAFGRGPLAWKHYQPSQLALDFCCC